MTDNAVETGPKSNNRSTRWVLFGIVGIPVIIIALSSLLYWLANSRVVELDTVNNGELIIPPVQFAEADLKHLNGSEYLYSELEPKWMFLVVGDRQCVAECERMLYLARQSIIALGKRMHRIRLGYLTTAGEVDVALQQQFTEGYQGIEQISLDEASLQQLLEGIPGSVHLDNSFYVIDPQGWLMMRYVAEDLQQSALNDLGKAIVRDMKRLIK